MALKEVFDALRTTILLNERVTSLAGQVQKLAATVETMDRRLVRTETTLELMTRGAFTSPGPAQDITPDTPRLGPPRKPPRK
jgi:hypothetical protein